MDFLSRLKKECLDFLFPRSENLKKLEHLSPGALAAHLPAAPPIDDDRTIAVFDYGHPLVRELVWELKYKGDRLVAEKLGEILYDVLLHEIGERAFTENFVSPVLVPVPTSDKRRRERGYNPAELLAEAILRIDRSARGSKLFSYDLLLEKVTHTDSQARTHATKRERARNLEHSMRAAKGRALRGAHLILLDDVTTSGATFAEARRALKAAGARKILCLALAH